METIKQTVAQNFGGAAHSAVSESQQFTLEQVPSLTGKVAVITGGSQGIGYAGVFPPIPEFRTPSLENN